MENTTIKRTWNPKSEYTKKLQDPRWQKRRLEIMQRDNFQCQLCGDTDKMLQIHHVHYCSNNPWEAENQHLLTVCKDCHEIEQEDIRLATSELTFFLKSNGFTSFDFRKIIEVFEEGNNLYFIKGYENYGLLEFFMSNKDSIEFAKIKQKEFFEKRAEEKKIYDESPEGIAEAKKREEAFFTLFGE